MTPNISEAYSRCEQSIKAHEDTVYEIVNCYSNRVLIFISSRTNIDMTFLLAVRRTLL